MLGFKNFIYFTCNYLGDWLPHLPFPFLVYDFTVYFCICCVFDSDHLQHFKSYNCVFHGKTTSVWFESFNNWLCRGMALEEILKWMSKSPVEARAMLNKACHSTCINSVITFFVSRKLQSYTFAANSGACSCLWLSSCMSVNHPS